MPGVNGLFVIAVSQIPVDGWRFIAAVMGEAGTGSIFYQMVNYCHGARERRMCITPAEPAEKTCIGCMVIRALAVPARGRECRTFPRSDLAI
jgi:hypothetical protein